MEERVVQGDRCYRRAMFFFFRAVCIPGGTPLSAPGYSLRPHGASSVVVLLLLVFVSKFNAGYEPAAQHARGDCLLKA